MINKLCSVKGCQNKHYGNDYCNKHYQQYRKHGKILERTMYNKNEFVLYDDYVEIILFNKKQEEIARALIDLEDIEKCREYKWFFAQGYVSSGRIRLHRFLLNAKDDEFVDHINRNPLDNQKANLRVCNNQENIINGGLRTNNKSGTIGVSLNKKSNKWTAQLMKNGKKINLGTFVNIEDAIKQRLIAELEHFGEFAPQRHLFEQYEVKEVYK